MPGYLRNQPRTRLTFVRVNSIFCFGWKAKDIAEGSGVSASDLTALGHMDVATASAISGRIMVTGANKPKPARVTKKIPNATVAMRSSASTFCAYDKLVTAAAAGWYQSSAAKGVKLQPPGEGIRKVTAIATLSNDCLYAFPLDSADFEANKGPLGLQGATEIQDGERLRLVRGSRTKPGRAAKAVTGGGTFSTFYSSTNETEAAGAGFELLSPEFIEYPGAAAPPPTP